MHYRVFKNKLNKATRRRDAAFLCAFGFFILCIVELFIIYRLSINQKVFSHPSWATRTLVSPTYLTEATEHFLALRFNLTPSNVSYQTENLLKNTDPSFYGELKEYLEKQEQEIKKNDLSFVFYPVLIQIDAKRFTSYIEGDLVSFVGSEKTSIKRMKYILRYNYSSGRLLLRSIKELKEDGGKR